MSNEKIKSAKIAVSGKSGCGNTTVSRILAEKLGFRFINFTFRNLAEERGITFNEILALAAKDDSWDREIDIRQAALARKEGGCILGSRLAIWMLPEADVKVFLAADHDTRAGRIQMREGGDFEHVSEFTAQRDRQDSERYLRIYNIDNDDYSIADLAIKTDNLHPEEIAAMIIGELHRKLKL